jgi:hypothetical protein
MSNGTDTPIHQGWFEAERDLALGVELLLIERRVDDQSWTVSGALVRPTDGQPRWVDGWIDTHFTAAPDTLWRYLVSNTGNAISWNVGFRVTAFSADVR